MGEIDIAAGEDVALKTLVVGVAGGTGSGKTTLVQTLARMLGEKNVAVIEHDAYYRSNPDLSEEDKALMNYDHPAAIESALLVQHLESLRQRIAVEIPRYDFVRHLRFPFGRQVDPRPTVIVEGILVLAEEKLRRLMDLRVFVETSASLRFVRRLRRDTLERGRTPESVVNQYLGSVLPMHQKYVQPSKRHADLVVRGEGDLDSAVRSVLRMLNALRLGQPGRLPKA